MFLGITRTKSLLTGRLGNCYVDLCIPEQVISSGYRIRAKDTGRGAVDLKGGCTLNVESAAAAADVQPTWNSGCCFSFCCLWLWTAQWTQAPGRSSAVRGQEFAVAYFHAHIRYVDKLWWFGAAAWSLFLFQKRRVAPVLEARRTQCFGHQIPNISFFQEPFSLFPHLPPPERVFIGPFKKKRNWAKLLPPKNWALRQKGVAQFAYLN